MIIRLSRSGLFIAGSILMLSLIYVFTSDLFLYYLASLLTLLMIADLFLSYVSLRKCSVTVSLSEEKTWVWRSIDAEVRATNCGERIYLKDLPNWLSLEKTEILSGKEISFKLKTLFKHYGNYELDSIKISSVSKLGIYIFTRVVGVSRRIRVYPEYIYWVYRLARFLRGLSLGKEISVSEIPALSLQQIISLHRSDSGDYFVSREYVLGESMRRIDWKATSRTLNLYIRDLRESSGGGMLIIYDTKCLGPYTCDLLASILLSLAHSVYNDKILPIYAKDIGGDGVVVLSKLSDVPRFFLREVFEKIIEVRLPNDLYEYLGPEDYYLLKKLLSEEGSRSQLVISRGEKSSLRGVRGVLVVSDLVNSISQLYDYLREICPGKTCFIIAPDKPWLDAHDLEQAYLIHNTYSVAKKSFAGLGKLFIRGREGFEKIIS